MARPRRTNPPTSRKPERPPRGRAALLAAALAARDRGGQPSLEVPAGRFHALRVVPEVWKVTTSAQPDARLRGATIWVADDPPRTLLRIRSEVFVGAVTLDLVKIDA